MTSSVVSNVLMLSTAGISSVPISVLLILVHPMARTDKTKLNDNDLHIRFLFTSYSFSDFTTSQQGRDTIVNTLLNQSLPGRV